ASLTTSCSISSTPAISVFSNLGISPFEAISVPPHGEEMARALRVLLPLDPQRADEVVHRARRALVLRSPAARKDVFAAERAPAGLQEEAQDLELLRTDIDRLAIAPHQLPIEVHLHLAESSQLRLLARRPPPQQSLDPRHQLSQPETLGQ